ncbi:MAG: hypothetical protein ACI8QZ_003597 [Chlamydiales bacterium]|jgi:hypothetical protein
MNILRPCVLAALLASTATAQDPCAWQAENNLVVVEVEAVSITGAWTVETQFAGFTGSSYYRWSGPNHFSQPGNGILSYAVEVHEAGRFELRIHNRHENSDSTEENDCWVRMDGGSWIKLYSNGSGTVSNWNWKSRFEINGSHSDAGFDLSLGRHELQISGRSTGFMIDRFNFYRGNPAGVSQTGTPPSPCGIGAGFCSSGANSTGGAALIAARGSVSVAGNTMQLVAQPVPAGTVGIFYFGDAIVNTPFGNGRRCVSGQTFRLPPVHASGLRMADSIDFSQGVSTAIRAGSSWHFQAWFRDVQAGGASYDTSNGLHLNFVP